ncbi:AAA family ATPase [Sphingomonas sp. IC-56]|uniref:AAA family ATPase n=1 Tax=Sphingomonas sp. IC-56 TaxID=2898529 RepID=UPI001E659F33|nr:AAA family ATPase [Sphingomonas sp. IC-56]MCD2324191.1 AAA family ATPase [Sphingomonas sp. IC-56]
MAARAAAGSPLLESLLGEPGIDVPILRRIADTLGRRHAAVPPATAQPFLGQLPALAHLPAQRSELHRQFDHLVRRGQQGRVRQLPGGAADVLFDLARPGAELLGHALGLEASVLANRYLDVTPQGSTGWAMLPLFLSLHAAGSLDTRLAETILEPAPARLIAVGGLSGTGKSTLAQWLAPRAGRAPGARVLRSDVFRKRLAGVAPETRLPPGHYTPRSDRDTYEAMFQSADDHLACGSSVILDAVFMNRSERDVALALALKARVPFTGIWLEAPERDRIARVTARENDASDATATVVRDQSRRSVGELATWHRIRANRPLELIVAAARGALERRPA